MFKDGKVVQEDQTIGMNEIFCLFQKKKKNYIFIFVFLQKIGPFKFSHSKLQDKKVLVESDVPAVMRKKVKFIFYLNFKLFFSKIIY